MWKIGICGLILALFVSCGRQSTMDKILEEGSDNFQHVLGEADNYELQILYVQIDRNEENIPSFNALGYRIDPNKYFYPASTVKMPLSFLALDKANSLAVEGLDKHTQMATDSVRYPQSPVTIDTTSESWLPSIGHYVRKIFLVSDNDAYNRLYEFVGQKPINDRLLSLGIYNTRIIHRLSDFRFGPEENRYTNPVSFWQGESMIYSQPELHSEVTQFNPKKEQQKGVGYIKGDELMEGPFDFSQKNFFPLPDQVEIMKRVLFPEAFAEDQLFNLTEDDYRYLYQAMSQWPRESEYPVYPAESYWDGYVKFFMFGDSEEAQSGDVRIFNKVGVAYGYLTDVAYIVDFENNIEFMLAATVHVNSNRIYNDGEYEYDEIGIPFLAELGRKVHAYELQRDRKLTPDLSKFEIEY